jgi:hypothetical protein
MKTIIITAAALIAANIGAAEIYHGLAEGNSDLSTQRVSAEDFVGVQPSVGASIDRYHGWADGNPDLFKSERSGPTDSGNSPDIYTGLGGNPDLRF